MTNPLSKSWRNAWARPDRRPIWQWASEEITLPSILTVTGKFNPEISRHFLAIFDALQDDLCRYATLMKPVDSGGSLIGDVWNTWLPANDPGACLVTFQSEDIAKKHAETRMNPMLESCAATRSLFPGNRNLKRIQEILFSNGMPLYFQGPALGNLQSQRIRYLRNEEIWMWPNGLRAEALGRIRNWEDIGMSKVYEPSQGGVAGDDLDTVWYLGTQEEWTVPCQSCGKFSEAAWGGKRQDGTRWGIVWDDNDHTRDKDGQWIIPALLPTIRWECQHCSHPHLFESCRHDWNRLGRYEARNPGAGPGRRSFHFDAIIIRSWEKQVEDFLRALQAYRQGIEEPLKGIVQKDRARSWSQTYAPSDRRTETYDITSNPEGDTALTVDVQDEGVFPAMVCTWQDGGKCLVRDYRLLYSESEIAAKQAEYKIPPAWVLIDSGWGATTRDVYRMCARRGWIACKGADETSFTHYHKRKDGRTVSAERSWKSFKGDPEAGAAGQQRIFAKGLRWSNVTIKSRLKRLIDRGHWVEPTFSPSDANWKRYQLEMRGEKIIVAKRKTDGKLVRRFIRVGPNHAWDCACEQVVFATVKGKLADFQVEEESGEPKTLTAQ